MPFYKLGDRSPKVPESGNYWVAPCASLIGHIQLDEEASVWFGAVLRGDNELIHIGARSNIQDGSVLHTDLDTRLLWGRTAQLATRRFCTGARWGKAR